MWRARAITPDGLTRLSERAEPSGVESLAGTRSLGLIASIAVAMALVVHVGVFLYAAIRSVVVAPAADLHDWDQLVFATEKSGRWLSYLWAPHTNQRIVFARILTWLDIEVSGARHVPIFLIATVATLLLSAGFLAAVLLRELGARGFTLIASALAAMLLIGVGAAEDCSFPAFSVYIFVTAFAAMALAAIELGGPSGEGVSGGATMAFGAAITLAILSGFGNAAGLAVWPVMAWSALRHHQPRWRLATIITVGVAYVAVSMAGLGAPSRHLGETSLLAPAHLAKMGVYFTAYCGLPWAAGGAGKVLPHVLGFAFAAGGAGLVLRGSRSGGAVGRIERIGLNLILFALLTAILATVGRVDEAPQPVVASRYSPFASLLQAGLILALIAPLRRAWERFPKRTGAVAAGMIALLLVQQALRTARVIRSAEAGRAASAAFDAGDRSPAVVTLVYPDPARAVAVRAELKRRGLPF